MDFLAPAASLVVEVDGGYHARRRRADAGRDRVLARAGYRVLRLEGDLVMAQLSRAGRVGAGALLRNELSDRLLGNLDAAEADLLTP